MNRSDHCTSFAFGFRQKRTSFINHKLLGGWAQTFFKRQDIQRPTSRYSVVGIAYMDLSKYYYLILSEVVTLSYLANRLALSARREGGNLMINNY
jgi:hypothetical protein